MVGVEDTGFDRCVLRDQDDVACRTAVSRSARTTVAGGFTGDVLGLDAGLVLSEQHSAFVDLAVRGEQDGRAVPGPAPLRLRVVAGSRPAGAPDDALGRGDTMAA